MCLSTPRFRVTRSVPPWRLWTVVATLLTTALLEPGRLGAREPWTTSRILGSPEAPPPFDAVPVYPEMTFDTPVDLVLGPEGRRMYLAERWGRLWTFDPGAAPVRAELWVDLRPQFPEFERLEIYSLAFHPRFAETREVYLRLRMNEESPDGSRVYRYRVTPEGRLDLSTQELVITFRSGSHAGGNILFGPDGFLYITTGDAGPASPPDIHHTGQTLDDLEAAILRIDVDRRDPGRAYAIPPDNPFVELAGARGEIWAYGLRNPWKICFRPGTSELWAADVGWEQWEMVHRIERGGNYGWSLTEGPQPVKTDAVRGPTPIIPPVMVHPHSEAASITGGFFYTGTRLPELQGAYVYGDYVTGRFWALWHDGTRVVRRQEIARTAVKVVTFGVGPDGELFFSDLGEGKSLLRFERQAAEAPASEFPRRLSETGLFSDTAAQRPHPGVTPYSVRQGQWVDGALAERWIAMPGDEPARLRDERRGPTRQLRATVRVGSVFARTLSLEQVAGDPSTRRRIETQVLHFAGRDWHGYTYRWNEAQTDAELVPAEGDTATFAVRDPAAPGGSRSLRWRFHHQAECMRCHNAEAGRVLGFIPGNVDLEPLVAAGVVEPPFAEAAPRVPLAALDDPGASAELRARSWLHVNCAHCHRFQGGGSGAFRVNIEAAADRTLLNTAPLQGDFGIPQAQLVEFGAPERSVLLYRSAKSGPGRMPQLGATTVDVRGLQVLWEWIAGEVPPAKVPSAGEPPATVSDALLALHRVDGASTPAPERERLIAAGLAATRPEIRSLFERFIPDAEREETLGADIDPGDILAVRGDPGRGRAVLTQAGCLACHAHGGEGRAIGPDLDALGVRLTREQLLESILQPSRTIPPEYQAHVFELSDGQQVLGFVRARDDQRVNVRTLAGEDVTLAAKQVRQESRLPESLMPSGLLAGLTAQQAADLLAALLQAD